MYHDPAQTAELLVLKHRGFDTPLQLAANNRWLNKGKNQERFDFWDNVIKELRSMKIKQQIEQFKTYENREEK